MIVSVHQPQYLPWLGYFDKIDKSDCFVFLDTVQYKPREFQNRNKIRIKDGWIWLSVPVKVKGHFRQKICDVEIDNEKGWEEDHKKSLMFWYAKAPFFKNYFPFFAEVYVRKWEKLIDLNIYIIKFILKELRIEKKLYLESEIGTSTKSTDRILELCQKLNADIYLSGICGKDYLEEEKFKNSSIKLEYQKFNYPRYNQQFVNESNPFEPYMTIVDLLFNEGPKSIDIIREAQKSNEL